jgi:16S rRNA (uracil1498-N3)-methyltransferase
MNSLVVFEEEGWQERRIFLTGDRAQAIRMDDSMQPGKELRVALFGGDKGIAKVCECSDARVVLEIVRIERSLPLRPVDVIVGLSRPQTLKKVIQAAVMAGVRSLHFVHLASGERSYLDSHILRPEDLRQEIAKALEQIWEGLYPQIQVHRSFRVFTREYLSQLTTPTGSRIVAHPGAAAFCPTTSSIHGGVTIAVGSEGGWSQSELATFSECGFVQVGLGQRVVRVEVALLYLLGQTLAAT